jgi:hypothetical protein
MLITYLFTKHMDNSSIGQEKILLNTILYVKQIITVVSTRMVSFRIS